MSEDGEDLVKLGPVMEELIEYAIARGMSRRLEAGLLAQHLHTMLGIAHE